MYSELKALGIRMTKSKQLSETHSAETKPQMLQAAMKHVPDTAVVPRANAAKGPWHKHGSFKTHSTEGQF